MTLLSMLTDLQIPSMISELTLSSISKRENLSSLSRNRFHKQWSVYLVEDESKKLFKTKNSQTPNQITKSGSPELRSGNLNFSKNSWVGLMTKKRPILKIQIHWLQDSRRLFYGTDGAIEYYSIHLWTQKKLYTNRASNKYVYQLVLFIWLFK